MTFILTMLLSCVALFLILLVLVQRGKGGGLSGALGGMGGQSAFGTKAGDLFTRITIGVAAFWIVLCIFVVKMMKTENDQFEADLGSAAKVETGLNPGPVEVESGGAVEENVPAQKDSGTSKE